MKIDKNITFTTKNNLEVIDRNASKSNFQKWQNLIKKKDGDKKKLQEVSQQIESIFLKMMYKEMKKGLGKNSIFKINQGQKIFSDMLLDERSKESAKYNSIGLSKIIYDNYKNSL